jgi:arylsulfatase A-like enzyme
VSGSDNDATIINPLENKWHYRDYVVRSLNQDRPFDEFVAEQLAGDGIEGMWVEAPGADRDQPDGLRARRAASLLERFRGRRFLLGLGLVRPHLRWIAPARYFGLYPPEAMAPVPFPADDLADVPAIAVKTHAQPLPGLPLLGREPPGLAPDPAFRRQAIAAYRACVSFADAQVGVVLDALDRLDLWKDTVVVLAGDNGFHLGEHAGLLRKDTLFEEALRVPLVVAAPGLAHAGAVVPRPVVLLDVYPTVVEPAGLPPSPVPTGGAWGRSEPDGPGGGRPCRTAASGLPSAREPVERGRRPHALARRSEEPHDPRSRPRSENLP